jgi:hypothetical protein
LRLDQSTGWCTTQSCTIRLLSNRVTLQIQASITSERSSLQYRFVAYAFGQNKVAHSRGSPNQKTFAIRHAVQHGSSEEIDLHCRRRTRRSGRSQNIPPDWTMRCNNLRESRSTWRHLGSGRVLTWQLPQSSHSNESVEVHRGLL